MKYKYICKIWKEAMKHTAPHQYKDYIPCTCKTECKFNLDIRKFQKDLKTLHAQKFVKHNLRKNSI